MGSNGDSLTSVTYPPCYKEVKVSNPILLPECFNCARGKDVNGCGDMWIEPGVQDKKCFRPIRTALTWNEVEE